MNTTSKVIAGVVLGAAIGMIAGILVAPTTGNRTRKNINKKAKKFVRQIEGYLGIKHKTTRKTRQQPVHSKNGRAAVAAR